MPKKKLPLGQFVEERSADSSAPGTYFLAQLAAWVVFPGRNHIMDVKSLTRRIFKQIPLSLYCRVFPTAKTISAVFRVKNEGLFLEAAVESILKSVDEIVIVDNQSTDLTLEVAKALQAKYAGKVKVFTYEYSIARVGEDNLKEYNKDPKSPHLLSNFSNFAFEKGTMDFLLRWDGDMIANHAFHQMILEFKRGKSQTVYMKGCDISRNSRKIDSVGSRSFEPRLYRRQFSSYKNVEIHEALDSPFAYSAFVYPDDTFIHLKFLKEDPFSNHSTELVDVRKAEMTELEEISQADKDLLMSHGIAIPAPQR